jgi:anti-sigma factor RsiW
MTNCDEIRPRLAAWIDGEVEIDDKAAMDAHVACCANCSAIAADFQSIKAAAPPDLDVDSVGLWNSIEDRLDGPEISSELLQELRAMRAEMQALRADVAELRRELARRPALPGPRTSPFSFPDVPERQLKQYRLV